MKRYGIRLLGLAGAIGRHVEEMITITDIGGWVASYDPDGEDGRGELEVTKNPDEALVFPSRLAALDVWRQQSTVRPYRADGKPNRPLTAFTVDVRPLPEEEPHANPHA